MTLKQFVAIFQTKDFAHVRSALGYLL